jgi:hypothetical protein
VEYFSYSSTEISTLATIFVLAWLALCVGVTQPASSAAQHLLTLLFFGMLVGVQLIVVVLDLRGCMTLRGVIRGRNWRAAWGLSLLIAVPVGLGVYLARACLQRPFASRQPVRGSPKPLLDQRDKGTDGGRISVLGILAFLAIAVFSLYLITQGPG